MDVGGFRVVLLGVCPLSQRTLTEQMNRAVRHYDLGALPRLPGSFLTFVRTPYSTYAAGDVTGVQRLHLSPAGVADSRPGQTTTPLAEATGAHLHDDGAIRVEPYWSPPLPQVPATLTGPLLGMRLRMAVAARADLLGASEAVVDEAVAALLRDRPTTLSGPRGRIELASAGFDALFRALPAATTRRSSPRLCLARAEAARQAGAVCTASCLRLPMLDAHVVAAALSTRERDIRRGRLQEQVQRAHRA
ncbi:hypothetical protein ACN28G_14405 [Micromonospora sp. WMMA1923]|uniref:hypothetical protein n=1 Tax=Micromonospora sp. WMMA1923 TaxID=3404125 RepID=UPI003B964606